jgi:hypothetical protein
VSLSATVKWVLLALAGLAIAIGIAIAAANLTSRQIGIASESVSAGDALAPALNIPGKAKPQESGGGSGQEGTATVPSYTPPATATEEPPFSPEEPSGSPDDHGGGGDSDGDDD